MQTTDDVYGNFEDHNPIGDLQVLIVFDDMIADMKENKHSIHIVTELCLTGRKLTASLVFIPHSYFKVFNAVRMNKTHCCHESS